MVASRENTPPELCDAYRSGENARIGRSEGTLVALRTSFRGSLTPVRGVLIPICALLTPFLRVLVSWTAELSPVTLDLLPLTSLFATLSQDARTASSATTASVGAVRVVVRIGPSLKSLALSLGAFAPPTGLAQSVRGRGDS